MKAEIDIASVPPPVEISEVARVWTSRFGGAAATRIRPLPGEFDASFEVEAGSEHVVFKLMHPGRTAAFIEMQAGALERVRAGTPDLRAPRVRPTLEGRTLISAAIRHLDGVERERFLWALDFQEGRPLAEVRPRTPELARGIGRALGRLTRALDGFDHPAAHRDLPWNLAGASWANGSLAAISDPARRRLVERAMEIYDARVVPSLGTLPRSVIHGDANDYNVIVHSSDADGIAVIDYGDLHYGLTAAEPATAAAYALLGEREPLPMALALVAAYHAESPLRDEELEVMFALIVARLAVSVTISAIRGAERPGDAYLTISEAPAWVALERLLRTPATVAAALFRTACGRPASADASEVTDWIRRTGPSMVSVLDTDLRTENVVVFDLSVGSPLLGADPAATSTEALTETLFAEMRRAGASVGVGRYDETRLLYVSPLFGSESSPLDERRTVHLGIDLFVPPGSRVRAPLDGVVRIAANNDAPQDYGPMLVLEHRTDSGQPFFTLYGHLSDDTLPAIREGDRVAAGQVIARVGSPPGNGDWAPHLHFQIILDLIGLDRDFPGVCRASERALWTALSPDPNLILGIPAERFGRGPRSREAALEERRRVVGGSVKLSYAEPLRIVRGFGAYLYDESGRAFLDMYNNVPLVGYSHPRVVEAVARQLALLNTNTRYLHDGILDYAERLGRLLGEPLSVCFFVNSGSEANDLALRIARAHTKRHDVIVLENAYHGHTAALIDASPYKFLGRGGAGKPGHVHVAPMPDDYRGPFRRETGDAGGRYAGSLGDLADALAADGHAPAAFIAETLPSVGGQIVPPPGYLAEAFRRVRLVGGLCIADEVQVGFGRLGRHFWGFEMQDARPDMVVLGKPIANGFPVGAVVTTPEIARSFDNGMEFFSTFGGSPVAAAAGMAVLDVLEAEGLPARASIVGERLMAGLRGVGARHPLVGDVRGCGLFLGVELVRDRQTLEPATLQARYVVNRLRANGVLAGTDGPHENVIKLRPPLVLSESQADLFLDVLDRVLAEDGAQPDAQFASGA